MDEKKFQLYAKAMAYIYKQTGKRYGESWKATFTLKGSDEKGASKDDGSGAEYDPRCCMGDRHGE